MLNTVNSKLSIIVATAQNSAIGRNNQLLWHIPEDLKYFKRVTSGHTVIMGRKTWESLGRPLPNRRNIVVSRTLKAGESPNSASAPTFEVYNSLEKAVEAASQGQDSELFIIGGGEIYKEALPFTNKLYLTIVNESIEDADTFFPEVEFSQWRVLSKEELDYGTRLEMVRI